MGDSVVNTHRLMADNIAGILELIAEMTKQLAALRIRLEKLENEKK